MADFLASSRSVALAAKISSRAAARASCMASKAVFLAVVERVARRREESLAMRAASEGDALVNDIFAIARGFELFQSDCRYLQCVILPLKDPNVVF